MNLIAVVAAVVSLVSLGGVQAEATDHWISTIWHDFKEAVDCASCQTLLSGLKLVAGLGEPIMEDVLTGVCKISGVEDFDVCEGIITSEGPALHYLLNNLVIDSHTAKTLCASLVGLCDYPPVRPFNVSFPSPKPPTTRPPPSGKPPIKVVHFSDTHVDLSYEVGSNYDCSKPICCRAYTEHDAPGNTSSPCGSWGNPKCDPPLRLHESMMAAIADINPAFSIYTGDVVAHDVWMVNKTEVLQDFNATYGAMENRLGLVYAALGNHDTAPVNLFPSNQVPSRYNPQWVYDALAADWKALAGLPSIGANAHGSYSAIHPNSNLRIISYNSIFYYKYNFFAYEEPMQHDPNDQLAWLTAQLSAAESASQRVWLISHIPAGNADHFQDHSHYIDAIVQRYEATIAALFFGHTHTDEFQLAYADYTHRSWDSATAIAYIAPSMTPTSGPPSFRVYDIDPETFAVLDFTQYVANFSAADADAPPAWVPYYSAKRVYGPTVSRPPRDSDELSPAFWHNVTVAMERDPVVFGEFWARRTRGFEVLGCTGDCVKGEICSLRGADAQFGCVPRSTGVGLTRRGMGLERRFPECNHAGMAPLLARMAHRARLVRE